MDETFEVLIDTLIGNAFRLGKEGRGYAMPELAPTRQAALDYVARLEARQITPDDAIAYIDGLRATIAAQKAEIERLKVNQITAEMRALWEEYQRAIPPTGLKDIKRGFWKDIQIQGIHSLEGVDMSQFGPMYITEDTPPVIPAESVSPVDEVINEVLRKAAEHPELDWTFEVRVDMYGKASIEARGKPRTPDTP